MNLYDHSHREYLYIRLLSELSFVVLDCYFVENIVFAQLLCQKCLMTRRQTQYLKSVVFASDQVSNHTHYASCYAKVILFALQADEVLVLAESTNYSNKALLLDLVLSEVELLEAHISLEDLRYFTASAILQTVLSQVQAS